MHITSTIPNATLNLHASLNCDWPTFPHIDLLSPESLLMMEDGPIGASDSDQRLPSFLPRLEHQLQVVFVAPTRAALVASVPLIGTVQVTE